MIVFEEKMRELVGLIPSLTDVNGNVFPVRFDWGTQDVLNKFLLLPESVSKYPLIWLVTGVTTRSETRNTLTRQTRLVIATRSSRKDQFNEFQYSTDYVNTLNPVYKNLRTLLLSSGISKIVNNTIIEDLRPNYSFNDNGKGLIDVWNAIVIDLEIELLTDRCISTIKF
jgi:hypothetical protein